MGPIEFCTAPTMNRPRGNRAQGRPSTHRLSSALNQQSASRPRRLVGELAGVAEAVTTARQRPGRFDRLLSCKPVGQRAASGERKMVSIEGLAAVQLGIEDSIAVFETLTDDEWARPSGCWVGVSRTSPPTLSSNFKAAGRPVASFRRAVLRDARRTADGPARRAPTELEPGQVLGRTAVVLAPAGGGLGAVQEPPLATTPLTMADLGTYPMHLLADAYAFDLYCHLRIDILAPARPIRPRVPPPTTPRRARRRMDARRAPQMQGDVFPSSVSRSPFAAKDPGVGNGLIRGGRGGPRQMSSPPVQDHGSAVHHRSQLPTPSLCGAPAGPTAAATASRCTATKRAPGSAFSTR